MKDRKKHARDTLVIACRCDYFLSIKMKKNNLFLIHIEVSNTCTV